MSERRVGSNKCLIKYLHPHRVGVLVADQLLHVAQPMASCWRVRPMKATVRRCTPWHTIPRTASWPARAKTAPSTFGTPTAEALTGESAWQKHHHAFPELPPQQSQDPIGSAPEWHITFMMAVHDCTARA